MSESISGKKAKEAAQRLINSHFGNADPARMSIPAQPTDDDLTIMAYIEQAEARLLSSPRVEDVRREERERIALIFEGQTHSEWLGQEAADMIRALSPPVG